MTQGADGRHSERGRVPSAGNASQEFEWRRLYEDYEAAVAARAAARAKTDHLSMTGCPLEYLEPEFLAEKRAQLVLDEARRKLRAFEERSDEVLDDGPDARTLE